MIVGCVAFPFGWNSNDFRKICGPESNRFELGLCGIRWAYPLAIIGMYWQSLLTWLILILIVYWFLSFYVLGCIDACILATLAFILATRHVRLQPEPMYQNSMFKGKAFNRIHHIVDIWTNCHVAGEVNNAYLTDAVSMAGSRKSLNLHPVLLVAPPHHMTSANGDDSVSQFSNRTPSRFNRSDFHNSMHHFQL